MLTAVYYRPPGQSADMRDLFLEQFSASVSQAIESNPTVLAITGDFNDRCLNGTQSIVIANWEPVF